MKKKKITITKRVKTGFLASVLMIILGLLLGSSILLLLGLGFQFFIWADLIADNLPLKAK